MRIRKNARPSTFLHPNSSHNNESTLCLLNQSPWDIISFPSSHSSSTSIHLFDDFVTCSNVNRAANWSSTDSVTAVQSEASFNTSVDCEYDNVCGNRNVEYKIKSYKSYQKEDELGFTKGDDFVDLQNDAVWSTKKEAQFVSKSRKKRAVVIKPKENEFYYYSGFGPTWGKKRGECTTFDACGTIVSSSGGVDDMDVEEEVRLGERDTTVLMRTMWSCQVVPDKEDFDYVDGELGLEQDDGNEKEKTGKKRGRKPIKARSLKSLM